ncbi:hypothetical protein [Corynebacterium variabile]
MPATDELLEMLHYYQDAGDRHEAVATACARVAHALDLLLLASHRLPGAPDNDRA